MPCLLCPSQMYIVIRPGLVVFSSSIDGRRQDSHACCRLRKGVRLDALDALDASHRPPVSRRSRVTTEEGELVTACSRDLDKLIKGLLYVANAQNCRNG